MTTKHIIKNDYLTIAQVKMIPAVVSEWLLNGDGDYSFDTMLDDQTKSFAYRLPMSGCSPEVLKIEKLEWTCNSKGRKNDYNSDITVWVTAIVDLGYNRIVRLSYDLLDSLIMTDETGCSGSIHQPLN